MRFLIDNQLPAALAGFLREAGFHASHVLALGLAEAPDTEIVRYASQNDFVIVTKDEDFGILSALGRCKPVVIWVRLGNCRKDALIKAFTASLDSILEKIRAGDALIELYD